MSKCRKNMLATLIIIMAFIMVPINVNAATSKMNKKQVTLYVGQTTTLKVKGAKKVTWKTSNKNVATVNKGKVVAKKKGKATITAKASGKKYTCKVTVKNPTLNKTKVTLEQGKTITLKLTGSKVKSWSSSNKNIATVNKSGKVTAKKPGTVNIKANAKNGKSYTCKITVKKVHTHKYTKSVTKEASCMEEGIETYKCSCGDKYTKAISRTGHTASQWITDKPATCVENGSKHIECTICKTILDTSDIMANGHEMSEWVCVVCGYSEMPEVMAESTIQGISARIEARKENNVLEGAMPCRGEAHALAVYITLKDLEPLSDWDEQKLTEMFFDTSEPEGKTGYNKIFHSMSYYFKKASYEKLSVSGTVEKYTTQKTSNEYENLEEICTEALDSVLRDLDVTEYDANKDGYLDAVYFLFSNQNFRGAPGNYVANYFYEYEGYKTTEAVFIGTGYCTDVSTLVHESVHLMGLPDIYGGVAVNTGGTYADSVMDGLASGIPGIMKYFFGWIDSVVEIADLGVHDIELKSYSLEPELAVIYPNGNKHSKYIFLVEYLTADACNESLDYARNGGGLRVWRVYLNIDGNYEIKGNSSILAPGNSPYLFLESIHPYSQEGYILKEGDAFTPYTVPSSYYTTGLTQDGGISYCSERLYSGISLMDIKIQDGSVAFKTEIAAECSEKTGNFEYQVLYGTVGSIGGNNQQEVIKITGDTELYIAQEDGVTIQTATETLPAELKTGYDGEMVRVFVSEDVAGKLASDAFVVKIKANTIKNSYGYGNEEKEIEIAQSTIQVLQKKAESKMYNNICATNNFTVPEVIKENDSTIFTVIKNTQDGIYFEPSVYRMIKYDITTNKISEQELLNQLNGQIELCNDIEAVSLYQVTPSSFVVLTTYQGEFYFDLYRNDGTYLASNVIKPDEAGESVTTLTSEGKLVMGVGQELYTIDFSEGIQYVKTDGAGYFWGVTNVQSIGQNKLLVVKYEIVEMWDDGTITELNLPQEEADIMRYGAIWVEEDNIMVAGWSGKNIVLNQYDFNLELKDTKILLENVPINPQYQFAINVQKIGEEYTLSFEGIPEEATISYANSYVYTIDGEGKVKCFYRYGDATFGYHAGFCRLTETDYVMIESNFFRHLSQ